MVELTALSSRSGSTVAIFSNFHASHGSTARFSRGGEKYCIYFVDNLLLSLTLKKNQNRLTVDEIIAKI